MPRTRLPMVYGEGLDRETGVMATKPGSMEHLKNVILYQGKAQIRRGMYPAASLPDEGAAPCTAVVLVSPLKSLSGGLIVGYYQSTGEVVAFRTDSAGASPQRIGVPPDWSYEADSAPPKLIAASIGDRVFVAHAELDRTVRQATWFYDANETGQLLTVRAVLDTAGEDDVKFIGVTRYLSYLVGWGWAGPDSPDRMEFVRTSVPDQDPVADNASNPDYFNKQHYFLAGQRGEAVFRCEAGASSLIVLKEHETYEITGYDRRTFTIQPLDPLFGIAAPRLAVNIDGAIFGWSAQGPRLWQSGAASTDLAIPLDLGGPDPSDLVAAGATADAFCAWHPFWRCVLFIFGQRVYCLSIRSKPWKWSYFELGVEPFSGGVLVTSATPALQAPTGYPSCMGADTLGDYGMAVRFSNNGATGSEVLEAWVKPSGGSWSLNNTTAVLRSAAEQVIGLSNLEPNTSHSVALRYRRGGLYAADYTGATPDDWTALTANPARMCTGLTTTNAARIITASVWSRVDATNEQIDLTIDGGDGTVDTEWQHSLDGSSWTSMTDIPAGAPPVAATYAIVDPSAEEEVLHYFRARPSGGSSWGPVVTCWMGPKAPLGDSTHDAAHWSPTEAGGAPWLGWDDYFFDDGYGNYTRSTTDVRLSVAWAVADASYSTEVYLDDGGGFALIATKGAGVASHDEVQPDNTSYDAKVRHKLTQFGVDDFSDYTDSATLVVPDVT